MLYSPGHRNQLQLANLLQSIPSSILNCHWVFPNSTFQSRFQILVFSSIIHTQLVYNISCLYPSMQQFTCWFHHHILHLEEVQKLQLKFCPKYNQSPIQVGWDRIVFIPLDHQDVKVSSVFIHFIFGIWNTDFLVSLFCFSCDTWQHSSKVDYQ